MTNLELLQKKIKTMTADDVWEFLISHQKCANCDEYCYKKLTTCPKRIINGLDTESDHDKM